MTTPLQVDGQDARVTGVAQGVLLAFQDAAVISAADIHVGLRLGKLGGENDESVLLAVALTVRAARLGSVCLELAAAPVQIVAEVDDPMVHAATPALA